MVSFIIKSVSHVINSDMLFNFCLNTSLRHENKLDKLITFQSCKFVTDNAIPGKQTQWVFICCEHRECGHNLTNLQTCVKIRAAVTQQSVSEI